MEDDTVSFCPFNQAIIVINVRSWLCDPLKLLFHDFRDMCVHECVFRRDGVCAYVHDKVLYKGSWHRIPGA